MSGLYLKVFPCDRYICPVEICLISSVLGPIVSPNAIEEVLYSIFSCLKGNR